MLRKQFLKIIILVIAIFVGYLLFDSYSVPISISGTGSMYPTFPKGESSTAGMRPYPFFGITKIARGDIVVVENKEIDKLTQEMYGTTSGWVKRVVALSGETIELKNGIVYINNEPLNEPYTAKPHSTFGENFLSECKKVTVPDNSIFVMGDNRKGSGDSREVGFIALSDVHFVLSLNKQKQSLMANWRDTSKDFDESTKIKIDRQQYLNLLNAKRNEAGVKPLKYQPKLEVSATSRGKVILKYDDFSFEATRSGYTQAKAMRDANYSNITYREAPTLGYYEASELIDNQFEFPETKKFLLNKDYQEIGIGEVEGNLNGCPAQVIVQHFAGYLPPNYKKDVIQSWKDALKNLKEIEPGWKSLPSSPDADRINQIISIRISNIEGIVSKMEANQWLTNDQNTYVEKTDPALSKEEESLAKKLNGN